MGLTDALSNDKLSSQEESITAKGWHIRKVFVVQSTCILALGQASSTITTQYNQNMAHVSSVRRPTQYSSGNFEGRSYQCPPSQAARQSFVHTKGAPR